MIPEAREVHLSKKDRKVLEERCRSPLTLQRDLKRARIVLLAAAARSTRSIAKEVGVQPRIVSLWRHRYADHGLEGLQSKPLPGKQPIYTKATDKRILKLLDKSPPAGYARWTGPLLAGELGDVDVQYVWRFLRNNKIDLAARKSWCESNDPQFTAKAADVVGLYVAPPKKAIVLCVDEKPSIQALERAQGYLKLPNGRSLTGQSHDYKRHGTTTLFAALEVATGKILATHSKRRRRVEFLDFMDRVTAAFPNRQLHVILDNLSTHKKNEDWLKKLALLGSQCRRRWQPRYFEPLTQFSALLEIAIPLLHHETRNCQTWLAGECLPHRPASTFQIIKSDIGGRAVEASTVGLEHKVAECLNCVAKSLQRVKCDASLFNTPNR